MQRSESIANLADALAKAQGAMRAAELDRANPFFKSKYATIASIWEAIRKPLSDNGLAVTQLTRLDSGALILETCLLHASGEWLSGELLVNPVKNDPQGIGSALTYARRYGLAAIVGAVSDEDDDGNSASRGEQRTKTEAKAQVAPAPKQPAPDNVHDEAAAFAAMQSRSAPPAEPISAAQLKALFASVRDVFSSDEQIARFKAWMYRKYSVGSTKDLTKAQASEIIDALHQWAEGVEMPDMSEAVPA